MTTKDNEDFMNSTKCWVSDNSFIDGDVKEIIVISLENIEALCREILISTLN